LSSTLLTQSLQNVHSKVQIIASVASGGNALLQFSQVGLSSSIARCSFRFGSSQIDHDAVCPQYCVLKSFKRAMLKHRDVQQCYYVPGKIDFVVVVTTRDLAEYEAFTRDAFVNNGNVRSFTAYVVMDPVKVGTALTL